jgi:hypothetical protein
MRPRALRVPDLVVARDEARMSHRLGELAPAFSAKRIRSL